MSLQKTLVLPLVPPTLGGELVPADTACRNNLVSTRTQRKSRSPALEIAVRIRLLPLSQRATIRDTSNRYHACTFGAKVGLCGAGQSGTCLNLPMWKSYPVLNATANNRVYLMGDARLKADPRAGLDCPSLFRRVATSPTATSCIFNQPT